MGGGYSANIKPDGTYELTSTMLAGDYIVTIDNENLNQNSAAATKGPTKVEKMAQAYREKMAAQGKGITPVSPEVSGTYMKIPAKYRDRAKSDLRATLTRGKNEKNFDLTD
jgi:hypothetical protein